MSMRPIILPALAGVLIVGCVRAPPPPPQAPRRPPMAPAPAPPPPSSAIERPFTPGQWRYANGVARFGATDLIEVRCDATRRVALTIAGARTSGVTLRASTTARTVGATPGATGSTVALAASDPLLDALAFSRGSFAVETGATVLTLPAAPEFARVIEDCRG